MEKLTKHKKKKGARKHGFFQRNKTHTGKNLLKRRRLAKRKNLTA